MTALEAARYWEHDECVAVVEVRSRGDMQEEEEEEEEEEPVQDVP